MYLVFSLLEVIIIVVQPDVPLSLLLALAVLGGGGALPCLGLPVLLAL